MRWWTRCGGCTNVMDERPPEDRMDSLPPSIPRRISGWWARLRDETPEEREALARRAEEANALIEDAALWVDRRRLETPAILFLEAHKPFSFMGSQFVALGTPFFAPLFGLKKMDQLYHLLENGENVDRLIRRIEERVNARERSLAPQTPQESPEAPECNMPHGR